MGKGGRNVNNAVGDARGWMRHAWGVGRGEGTIGSQQAHVMKHGPQRTGVDGFDDSPMATLRRELKRVRGEVVCEQKQKTKK